MDGSTIQKLRAQHLDQVGWADGQIACPPCLAWSGVSGWLTLFRGALPVERLELVGPTSSELLAELSSPELLSVLPTLQELVLQDMDPTTTHDHLSLWLQNRRRIGHQNPTYINTTGDYLDDLAVQVSKMCGPEGFSLYEGDRLVASREAQTLIQ